MKKIRDMKSVFEIKGEAKPIAGLEKIDKEFGYVDRQVVIRAYLLLQQTDTEKDEGILLGEQLRDDSWWKQMDVSAKRMIGKAIKHYTEELESYARGVGAHIKYRYYTNNAQNRGLYKKIS